MNEPDLTTAAGTLPGRGLGERPTRSAAVLASARRRSAALGQAFTSLCGGALALNLLFVVVIMLLLAANGLSYFWQKDLVRFELREDGRKLLGEVWEVEKREATPGQPALDRFRLKIGNRDLVGLDFVWIDEKDVVRRSLPRDVVVLERLEWGNFYGRFAELRRGEEVLARGPRAVARAFGPMHEKKLRELQQIEELEQGELGDVNHAIEELRLDQRRLELDRGLPAAERSRRGARIAGKLAARQAAYETLASTLADLRARLVAETVVMQTVDGATREMPVANVVRVIAPNGMSWLAKTRLYLARGWEFVSGDPRESNTEGGIFPAIFGTVMMVFLMSFAVTPLSVLAAIYLREYAKQGLLVRLVRIAVNNLAGVPSIVFGMFGLAFFVYLIGGSLDRLLYPEALPSPTFGTGGILWAALTLALLTAPVVIVAAEEGLAAVPRIVREGSLALGATKFETIWRVVLPAAAPGILTGMILAMARAAGEVAPLMIVGMVKLAPTLPIDGIPPFVHFERKFMHLGFHIYDVGFQSPNIEATTPLVFATALLLIAVVTVMNLVAIGLRNHLRRKYAGSSV
jgi:phosphate transport system permease protein